jgi:hypothetical protein
MSDLILGMNEKDKSDSLTIYRDHWSSEEYPVQEIADQIIDSLKNNVKLAVKVRAKEAKVAFEPELHIKGKINAGILSTNMKVLNRKLASTVCVLQSALKNTNIIVNHRFKAKNSAWGLKSIQKFVDDVKETIDGSDAEIDKTDFYKEMLDRTIGKLALKLGSEVCLNSPEEKKIMSQVLIPDILDNYEKTKDLTSKVVLDIVPLVYIGDVFKKNTNYPVNWFISDDIIMNLNEDYKFLIGFMQEIPRIEANAIVPLDIFKDQLIK